jgi:hypothetical protein
VAVLAIAGAGGLYGCELGGGGGAAGAEPVVEATVAGDVALVAVERATTTTSLELDGDRVDGELVDACIEYVQFHAYVGDARGRELWERAGATADGLRVQCTTMAATEVDVVEAMAREMHEIAEEQAAANASTTLAPGCHPDYGGCLPIVSDIDCVGDDDGDGPVWQAVSVLVFGDDPYELDKDRDGLACEPGDR